MGTLGEAELDAMIEEATVDAYNEDEQLTGLFTMLEEHLVVPFTTAVLGVKVTVRGVDLTPDGRIVAVCSRGGMRQSIGILELELPRPAPEGGVDRGVPSLGRMRPGASHFTTLHTELACLEGLNVADAVQGADRGAGEPSLTDLIERSAELKGQLVAFAQSARFDRWLTPLLLEAAGPERRLDEGAAIRITDHFILQYRLPDGSTVVDRFVAGRKDLTAADREILLGWRDPVEGIFKIQRKEGDAAVLLNLVDDLEYRTYSNVGRAAFRGVSKGGFLHTCLVPVHSAEGAWLVSGAMSYYPRSSATEIARAAIELATGRPELVFRNPEKIEQGWQRMREDRAAFIEFCGGDELVLPPAEAEDRLNAYYRHRQEAAVAGEPGPARSRRLPRLDLPFFELPRELADSDTVGVIYDEVDGLNFYADYGMLRDLFADPALAGSRQHQDLLRTYLREESITPLPIRRLAAAHPETTDVVFRKLLRKPGFTWSEHGEALLRRRKPWYYENEPRPGVSVIGDRLSGLAAGRR
ncbi:hypothetical protein [Streptomyces sp. NBC_00872]|uniref:hypothetical protein n=1 Tax=Streptomyces sp. NBC_00872 TaxID=2903686 RepID=UPI003870DB8D|nr:calcium-binding protein [Streptomyces sp. NBC_00872]